MLIVSKDSRPNKHKGVNLAVTTQPHLPLVTNRKSSVPHPRDVKLNNFI